MKKTTGVSGERVISQLLQNDWELVIDPDQLPTKTAKKSFNAVRSKYPDAKVSRTGDSVYLTNGEAEVSVKCKGHLTFVQLDQIQRVVKFKFDD